MCSGGYSSLCDLLIVNSSNSSKLMELDDNQYDHDKVDQLANSKSNSPGGLTDYKDGVDKSVDESGQCEKTEHHKCHNHVRISKYENESSDQKNWDVF